MVRARYSTRFVRLARFRDDSYRTHAQHGRKSRDTTVPIAPAQREGAEPQGACACAVRRGGAVRWCAAAQCEVEEAGTLRLRGTGGHGDWERGGVRVARLRSAGVSTAQARPAPGWDSAVLAGQVSPNGSRGASVGRAGVQVWAWEAWRVVLQTGRQAGVRAPRARSLHGAALCTGPLHRPHFQCRI